MAVFSRAIVGGTSRAIDHFNSTTGLCRCTMYSRRNKYDFVRSATRRGYFERGTRGISGEFDSAVDCFRIIHVLRNLAHLRPANRRRERFSNGSMSTVDYFRVIRILKRSSCCPWYSSRIRRLEGFSEFLVIRKSGFTLFELCRSLYYSSNRMKR